VLTAKLETAVGTAETLSGTNGAFNAFDVEIQPDIAFADREGQQSFSPLTGTLGPYGGTAKFKVELCGGAAPAWATTFLPACGLVVSAGVWTPLSAVPVGSGTSGVHTATIGVWEDGLYKSIRGAMGNPVFTMNSGKVVMAEFSFTGIWVDPVDADLPSPTYPLATIPLRFASSSLQFGTFNPRVEQLTFDLGNELHLREDSRDPSGYASAIITGRKAKGTLNPEAGKVADYPIYTNFTGRTEVAMSLSLSSADGSAAFAMPKTQITKSQEGDRNKVQIDQLDYVCNRSSDAGDDEFSITFAAP